MRQGPMPSWTILHRCLGTQSVPGASPESQPPNLPLPSAPQVFERSSVSSLPPTPRRQPIPTLLSPQDLGSPGGSALGSPWKVTGLPAPLTALSACSSTAFFFRTFHANPLTRHPRQPLCHCPSFTPARGLTLLHTPRAAHNCTTCPSPRLPQGSSLETAAWVSGVILEFPSRPDSIWLLDVLSPFVT